MLWRGRVSSWFCITDLIECSGSANVGPMADPCDFHVRLSRLSAERRYRLTEDALEWRTVRSDGRIAYQDIREIKHFRTRVFGAGDQLLAKRWRCQVLSRDGRRILLAPDHYRLAGRPQDRHAAYVSFVNELTQRALAARPDLQVIAGEGGSRRSQAFVGFIVRGVFALARRAPRRGLAAVTSRTTRILGPR